MKRMFPTFCLLLSLALPAQVPPAAPMSPLQSDIISLSALFESLSAKEREQDELHRRLQAAGDEVQRAAILAVLGKTIEEVQALRTQFQNIALSTDTSLFESPPESSFDLQSELEQLLQPLLAELKEATKESRELEQLNSQLDLQTRRQSTARNALANLDRLLAAEMDPALHQRLSELRNLWQTRFRDSENQLTAIRAQLDQRLAQRESVIDRTRGAATTFVRTRGRNLTLGVLAFLAVYLGMSKLYLLYRKFRPVKERNRSFSTRLFTLIWTLMGVLAAIGATLAVFNATGDWFLLSLTIVFLLGVGWAGMKTLPAFMEQFRMMLNMGAVKENERLLYEGIPWKVDAIHFRTRLVNPLLDGGELTLPTPMLVGLHSRPLGSREELFPSRDKDWVLLDDGTYGRVAYQNPAFVQIVQPGGSQKMFPTAAYLSMAPLVLSTGFRREIVFGLDYRHQAEITTVIPQKIKAHLQPFLDEKLGNGLQHLGVSLLEAAGSSLNLAVVIDCGPDLGQNWGMLPRWVHSALVELCTRENWSIPFPQLQIHSGHPLLSKMRLPPESTPSDAS